MGIPDAPEMAVFGMPGGYEMWIVLAIVLLLFGPKNLPKLARSVGRSIRDFKSGLKDVDREIEEVEEEVNAPVETQAHIEDEEKVSATQPRQPAAKENAGTNG